MGHSRAASGLILLLLGALCACGPARAYDGPMRPSSQVAVLRVVGFGTATGYPGDVSTDARIVKLDGKPYRGVQSIVQVLPGKHTLEILWTRSWVPLFGSDGVSGFDAHEGTTFYTPVARGTVDLEVDARAGRRYELTWSEPERQARPVGFEELR